MCPAKGICLVSINTVSVRSSGVEIHPATLRIVLSAQDTTLFAGYMQNYLRTFIASYIFIYFEELEYLSSAGLRVLLTAQKTMNKQGEMIIKNVNETINEIFEVTGFIDILTIE